MAAMSTPRILHVTVDCSDAATLAGFWAQVLGWEVGPGANREWAEVGGPARPQDTPGLLFLRVPEPKIGKARIHLDLQTEDLDAEVRRLQGLGAAVLHERREHGVHWFTFTDPEGNEFCVAGPPAV
jgi:predicted enzyme related to lactoylglutathione lyase